MQSCAIFFGARLAVRAIIAIMAILTIIGVCQRRGLGDVGADLVEEGAEGGGIAGLDDGGEFGELGAYGA